MNELELLQQLADVLPGGAEVENTGGGVYVVSIPLEGRYGDVDHQGSYALVSTDFSEEGTWALGVYNDDEDEGAILKEWARSEDVHDDVEVITTALDTWSEPSFDAVEAVGLDGTLRTGSGDPYGWSDVLFAR